MAGSTSPSCRGRARLRDADSTTRRSSKTSATRWCCMSSRCDKVGRRLRRPTQLESKTKGSGEEAMKSSRWLILAATTASIALPAFAADVTPERLLNADKEPQNWLMNHRSYDGQRYSPLERINKSNVKGLKLAYAVPLGGGAGNEWNEATALAEDGFLYITDSWGVLYKIDARSGDVGRIVWRMDPKQERQVNNRGAAFWGNLVITPANGPARIIATDKDTGKVVWETHVQFDQPLLQITGAVLPDRKSVV